MIDETNQDIFPPLSRAPVGSPWDHGQSPVSSPDYLPFADVLVRTDLDRTLSKIGRGPKNWVRPDKRIEEDIGEILTHHPFIDASDIEFDVHDGIVTLRGVVIERDQKWLTEDAIEKIGGVKEVRNKLKIASSFFSTPTTRESGIGSAPMT